VTENRGEEIRYLNSLSEEQVIEKAGKNLMVLPDDPEAINHFFADEMAKEISSPNSNTYIFPYGRSRIY